MVNKMKMARWFKANGEDREFMYLHTSRDKSKIQELINWVKQQGDIYRVTRGKNRFTIWDARV